MPAMELESDYLAMETDTAIRATKLTQEQLQLSEMAVIKLGEDWPRLLDAADYWLKHGRHHAFPESPRLDEAVKEYLAWLQGSTLREPTKTSHRIRINIFANGVPNLRVADIGPEVIEGFLEKRNVSAVTRANDRRTISAFFSWCMERKRRWCVVNPCSAVRIEPGEEKPPAILSVAECQKLMQAAELFERGGLVPYLAVCLFGGLRPFGEAPRLSWPQVNLRDNEIRLEGEQTKTGRPRVVAICPALCAWLRAYQGREFCPPNSQGHFRALKEKIGYGTRSEAQPKLKPWPMDVMRHTAISHYFRKTGSYGQTAEQFGNSEAIIKRHYQGRVTSEETERFYAIRPKQKGARQ